MASRSAEILDINQEFDIINCVTQYVQNNGINTNPFILAVYFSDMANQLLQANCPENGYSIVPRSPESYQRQDNQSIIHDIWNKGYLPIEVVKNDRCFFFGIPRHIQMILGGFTLELIPFD